MAKVRREKKGQENSMQTLFTERIRTLAPTVRSFKEALHSSHSERSSSSRSYQRQCLSQNVENGPVTATPSQKARRLQWRRNVWIYLCCPGSVQCRRSPCVGWFLGQWSRSCTRHPSEIHQHDGDAQELSTGLKIHMTMRDKVKGEGKEVIEKGWSFSEHPLSLVIFPFTISISNPEPIGTVYFLL